MLPQFMGMHSPGGLHINLSIGGCHSPKLQWVASGVSVVLAVQVSRSFVPVETHAPGLCDSSKTNWNLSYLMSSGSIHPVYIFGRFLWLVMKGKLWSWLDSKTYVQCLTICFLSQSRDEETVVYKTWVTCGFNMILLVIPLR